MRKRSTAKQQQMDYAKLLYLTENITKKDLAARIGVTEKTIADWIDKGSWEKLTVSLVTSKSDQIRRYYAILNAVTDRIENTEGGYGDTKLADMSIKYSAVIESLETQTNAGAMFETGMAFIRFVMKSDLELGKEVTNYFDAFINVELNKRF